MKSYHNNPTIRPAVPDDIEWIRPLAESCKEELLCDIEIEYKNSQREFLVIEGKAFIYYTRLQDGSKEICGIAVHENCRRQGLAKALIYAIGHPLIVATLKNLPAANFLYDHIGFSQTGYIVKEGHEFTIYYKE